MPSRCSLYGLKLANMQQGLLGELQHVSVILDRYNHRQRGQIMYAVFVIQRRVYADAIDRDVDCVRHHPNISRNLP